MGKLADSIKVFKYEVWQSPGPAPGGRVIVKMPAGAEILSAATQTGREVVVWARVAEDNRRTFRHFRVIMTGQGGAGGGAFVGTVLLDGGSFVLHVFDLGEVGDD